jgi:hypothetical protein
MKAYLITTGTVFGLIVLAHLWRVFEEGAHLARDPVFILLTVAAGRSEFLGLAPARPLGTLKRVVNGRPYNTRPLSPRGTTSRMRADDVVHFDAFGFGVEGRHDAVA